MIEGRRAALLGTLIVALAALALLARFPSYPMIFAELNDAAHAPVFGALVMAWEQLLRGVGTMRRRSRYLVAFALAVAAGGAIELIQPAMGRDAEVRDFMTDALGAIAGLAVIVAGEMRRKAYLWIALAALVPVLLPVGEAGLVYLVRANQFPTLLGNDTLADRYFVHSYGVELTPSLLPPQWRRSDDPRSLRICIRGGPYPRIAHREPQSDWRRYHKLMLDITNPDDQPLTLTLTLRVRDSARHNRTDARFRQRFTLAASTRTVLSFPLGQMKSSPVGGSLDVSRIASVNIFGRNHSELVGREYYLTRLWLE